MKDTTALEVPLHMNTADNDQEAFITDHHHSTIKDQDPKVREEEAHRHLSLLLI